MMLSRLCRATSGLYINWGKHLVRVNAVAVRFRHNIFAMNVNIVSVAFKTCYKTESDKTFNKRAWTL